MSGTGNSYKCAVWAAESMPRGSVTSLIPFEKADLKKFRPAGLTALFFPTHGFTLPWAALMFCLKMPRSSKSPVFISASRAGWFLGPWGLPGMEGTACLIAALILFFKGWDTRGFWGIDMPSNWLDVHPGMNEAHAQYFFDRAKPRIQGFISGLSAGKRIYRSFICWLLGILLLQISFMYLIFARLMLAKIKFADERCNSCGICSDYCPFGAIKMLGPEGKKRPYWKFNCESCERCMAYCPQKAIQAAHSYVFMLYWLIYGVLGFIPLYFTAKFEILNSVIPGTALGITWALLFFFTGQWLLHFITRSKAGAVLFSHTTFTRLFKRYRQKDASLKKLIHAGVITGRGFAK